MRVFIFSFHFRFFLFLYFLACLEREREKRGGTDLRRTRAGHVCLMKSSECFRSVVSKDHETTIEPPPQGCASSPAASPVGRAGVHPPVVEHLGHGCTIRGDRLHLRTGSAIVCSASAAAAGRNPGGSGHRAGAVARRVSTRQENPFRVGVSVAILAQGSSLELRGAGWFHSKRGDDSQDLLGARRSAQRPCLLS